MSTDISLSSSRLPMYAVATQKRITGYDSATGAQWTIRILAAIALTSSLYLAWIALTHGAIAGCGTGGPVDCSYVLDSRWSTVFGMPVSVPAIALHSTVLALLFVPKRSRLGKWSRSLVVLASFSAGLGALWFLGLQIIWLQHICVYCVVVHVCGIGMAATAAWWGRSSPRMTAQSLAIAGVLLSVLIAGQVLATPPEKFEIIEHDRQLPSDISAPGAGRGADHIVPSTSGAIFQSPLSDSVSISIPNVDWSALWNPVALVTAQVGAGAPAARPVNNPESPAKLKTATILNGIELDVTQWPLLGTSDAEIVIAEMLDYTCVHCRNTHHAIQAAMQQYGGRLAVVVLPVPLDSTCNPKITSTSAEHAEACQLAKLAIAVWHQAPDQFGGFHQWLMVNKRSYTQAVAHAETLIDKQRLRTELDSRVPSEFIAKNVELYQRASAGTLPKLLFPRSSAVGEIRSSQAIVELIHQNFAVR